MSIRSLRKKMKLVIILITAGFFLSMLTVIANYVDMGLKNKQYAFKINGNKVPTINVEREINNIDIEYSKYFITPINRQDATVLAVDNIISKQIMEELGEEFKIEISHSEVNKQFDLIKNQFPNKKQFSRMLRAQGFTQDTLKKSIKTELIIKKTQDKMKNKIIVTEKEINNQYKKGQYSIYLGSTYNQSKSSIEQNLKKIKYQKELLTILKKLKKAAKITDIRKDYGNILPKVVFEKDNFKITNLDIIKNTPLQFYSGVKNYDIAKTKTIEFIKSNIDLAEIAVKKGAKTDTKLPAMAQIMNLQSQLQAILKKDVVVNNKTLKQFFTKNEKRYDTAATVDANIIDFSINPTNNDKENIKAKANSILKKLTPKNFVAQAKLYSEGPKSSSGGELGWVKKEAINPEFQKAAFGGKVGTIYNKLIKTKVGYHIIYIEDRKDNSVKLSQILIKIAPSKDTVDNVLKTANVIEQELKNKTLTFENSSKENYSKYKTSKYSGITTNGYIKSIGVKSQLTKKLFSVNLNDINKLVTTNSIYIYQKTAEVKYKKAIFEQMKNRVIYDYTSQKAFEIMNNMASKPKK